MRLDKVIEQNLQTTRKEMKRLFLMKKVFVDGRVELNPQRNVDSRLHKIFVGGQALTTNHVYYLLNKPAGVVTAKKDSNFQTATELIAKGERPLELYPVGRLDRDTTGLLLLTDNGQLGYDLLQPHSKVEKTYRAVVNEQVTLTDVAAFASGIVFHGGVRCQPAQLNILSAEAGRSEVLLTIKEGKFHQVKKMFLARGKKVTSLTRLTMGPLELPQELAEGEYRPLTLAELQQLKTYFR
ncbi:16S rRNA pseudouridine(516) synthase [Enterococcus xiangfangensis]|uniref:16S rRNA pseudouridine(516) synthase n=1 Tax=Enterococcus xiangfangensis TaxID=1296537 RepID=UPI0010F8D97C|nr:16S rRNA pseudouridine(516) synthase [Enterococcus xiangfangensis]MBM7711931.1 16S rRNA pseudouridine516 synthase [Enterococcus xiangfangensis]NBK08103.1 16S rRNA pseudouridine(516) synthase [Enterococcus asini]